MLIDRLLSHVEIRVDPFAVCLLGSGWRLRLPEPADTEFHFVVQGRGLLRGPDGKTHALERYSLAVVPKGMPHALECGPRVDSERVAEDRKSDDGVVRFVAGATGEDADFRVACGIVHVTYGDSLGLFERLREVVVANLSGVPQARSAFEALLAEQGGVNPGSFALTQALMSQCLVYLLRHLAESSDGHVPWLDALEDPALAPAIDLIFAKPGAQHTVASLAEAASMSRSRFAKRFHDAFGCSPIRLVHDLRLRQAATLLGHRGDLSLDQIARRVGFRSRSHFFRAFKEHFHRSPVEFRSSTWGGADARGV